MKNSIARLWIIARYVFGTAIAFVGMLLALPCALLYAFTDWLVDAAAKVIPKEVHKDTGDEIIEEIAAE